MKMVAVPTERTLLSVRHMGKAGLKEDENVAPVKIMARNDTVRLFSQLNLQRNCFVRGPPGSGKSSSVWFWLLAHLEDNPGTVGKWIHFGRVGWKTITISFVEGEFIFSKSDDVTLDDNVSVLVIDGVRENNRAHAVEASTSAFRKGGVKVIWVTSQQVNVGAEDLAANGMDLFKHYSWTEVEATSFIALLSMDERESFRSDVSAALGREFASAEDAVTAKFYYFGGSARWLFSMNFDEATGDLANFAAAIVNAELVQRGLMGEQSETAVNHITSEYPPNSDLPIYRRMSRYELASKFLIEYIAREVGVSAIVAMYNSNWVRGNSSVRGFVFEWDILAQAKFARRIQVCKRSADTTETWRCESYVTLGEFLKHGLPSNTTMIEPDAWNYPEVDGFYVRSRRDGLHLIAWNASIATSHTGNVHNLLSLLEALSQRETNAVSFQSVRFAFIVPMAALETFRAPDSTAAKKSLHAWKFNDFDVFGMEPSS